MKTFYTCISLFLLFHLFNSCKPDCKKDSVGLARNLYKNDISALFPYRGDEKLTFLKNGTDTVIFHNLGFLDGYNYTFTQTDCPSKIPLQYKSMAFIDSIGNNSFQLINYITNSYYLEFNLMINNKSLYQGGTSSFILLLPPYTSLDVNGKHFDSLVYQTNNQDYLYFKTYTTGMVKFKTNNNVFELIP